MKCTQFVGVSLFPSESSFSLDKDPARQFLTFKSVTIADWSSKSETAKIKYKLRKLSL